MTKSFFLTVNLGSLVTSSELQCKKLSKDLISPQRIRCYSSNSHTVWDFVRGHVVVRQPLSLVPPLDGAGYLCQLLPELLHGLLHWLLYEVLIRIHAQVQLRGERGDTSLCLEAHCMLKQKETCLCVCVCMQVIVCVYVCLHLVLLVLAEGPDSPQVPAGASAIREALDDQVHICQALLFRWGLSHGGWSIGDPGTPVILHNVKVKKLLYLYHDVSVLTNLMMSYKNSISAIQRTAEPVLLHFANKLK